MQFASLWIYVGFRVLLWGLVFLLGLVRLSSRKLLTILSIYLFRKDIAPKQQNTGESYKEVEKRRSSKISLRPHTSAKLQWHTDLLKIPSIFSKKNVFQTFDVPKYLGTAVWKWKQINTRVAGKELVVNNSQHPSWWTGSLPASNLGTENAVQNTGDLPRNQTSIQLLSSWWF